MKTCTKCGETKNLTKFSYTRRAINQKCSRCKQCQKKSYEAKARLVRPKGPLKNYLLRNQKRANIEQTREKKYCGECFNNAGGYCRKLFQRYKENAKGTLRGLQMIKAKNDFKKFNYCLDFE